MTTKYDLSFDDVPDGAKLELIQHNGPPLLRTSERSDFKSCPWFWWQSWVLGLTGKRVPTWAWFGTAFHAGLEARYKPGAKRGSLKKVLEAGEASLDNELRKVYTAKQESGEDMTEEEETEIVDGRELLFTMLKGYVEHYGPEKDIYVVHSEQSFQIDVPNPDDPKGPPLCVYAGTWDSVWLIDGVYWIVDHKTRRFFPANTDFYDINDQAGSYLWVAPEVLIHMGVLTKKQAKKIMGLQFNMARKAMPDPRPDGPDGLKHNNPTKQSYVDALSPVMDLPTRLPTIAVLDGWAKERDITVWGDVSAKQPAELFKRVVVERSLKERVTQGQRVQAEAKWMNAIRTGKMPLFKTPTEDCVRCKLFDYCQAHEYDPAEAHEIETSLLTQRDPYTAHREMMDKNGVEVKKHG